MSDKTGGGPGQRFSWRARGRSFVYAARGLAVLLREEHNARIHAVVGACVVLAGFYFGLSSGEWLAVLVCIGLVFAMELINSAIENLCDYVSAEKKPAIGKTKDLAAAAVLVSAATAAAVGLVVFLPKLLEAWQG
ncbi:MAG: diacylglycerol kinase family protein [Bacteroidetes bacterium]|jgi:diacylglycerol kinase|nr:diacylglycerol kinase family protein [Bacteroidota bacterium]